MSSTVSAVCLSGENLRDLFRFVARDGTRRSNGVLPATFCFALANSSRTSKEKVSDVVLKQAALVKELRRGKKTNVESYGPIDGTKKRDFLDYAYDRCGTLLMTPERQRAIWAIYVWGRRTDELVDGPNASNITQKALDRWEKRLIDIYEGHPYDMYDAALCDTLSNFDVHIQPFMDLIQGMRMDLEKSRYKNFDELYMYCYYVAGTVGLMSLPVMGIAPESKASTVSVCNAALTLGIANQLTNILRDVGEDAKRGRIYLPQDELRRAGIAEDAIFRGKVSEKWRNFMREQIKRARMFFDDAGKGIAELNSASRWPLWSSLLIYRKIMDAIEANDYDNFKKRAVVGQLQKLIAFACCLWKSSFWFFSQLAESEL